ncbi:unnamed protein product [Soboliphyme baturini]|uniref:SH2 domain-containing protein n=1 Tax=Soboliphyme baturini TaxID=241478 RepID=A0A183IJ25_9BILA|nr:unnamed protein product [Soboliphyme baturini]
MSSVSSCLSWYDKGSDQPLDPNEFVAQSARECALLDHRPPQPLYLLPYYHGTLTVEDAEDRLHLRGQFLLFQTMELQLQIMVLGENDQSYSLPIHQDPDSTSFWIQPEDMELQFTAVEKLITYYITYKIPIKALSRERNKRESVIKIFREPGISSSKFCVVILATGPLLLTSVDQDTQSFCGTTPGRMSQE